MEAIITQGLNSWLLQWEGEGGREVFFLIMWLEIPVPYNWSKVTVFYKAIQAKFTDLKWLWI